MKTQIITLASHDDLVSVRDRMSWAKSPRILLVCPAHEQILLRALDLRILQQHARDLGAQIGLVTRRGGIGRDAEGFGIPVFRSTAQAQRETWPEHRTGGRRQIQRMGSRMAELRRMKQQLRRGAMHWSSRPVPRIGCFVIAVLAVFCLASLFVPRGTIVLRPVESEQRATIAIEVSTGGTHGVLAGGLLAQTATVRVSASQTTRVQSQSEVPRDQAAGIARFRNVSQSPVVIPVGTVVYSMTPSGVRFATLEEARLEGGANAIVDVPIVALEAGGIGNVPANAIQGIEGSLGASTTVANPGPTAGGLDAVEIVATQADRDQLRAIVLHELEGEAGSRLAALVAEEDVVLPDSLVLASIDQETFDPPAGQPASVLSLTMTTTYSTMYVRGADLRRLAEATLNSEMPTEYMPKEETLTLDLISESVPDGEGSRDLRLESGRTIMRGIDVNVASLLVRGKTPKQAVAELQSALPLSAPPEIRLTPSWWPWLPLIPFRLDVVVA